MTPPKFWQHSGWQGFLLSPLGWLYGLIVEARFKVTTPKKIGIPVICIGNFTLGGAGKTPVALYVAQRLRAFGLNPFFLSRGYGGKFAGPHRVDAEKDSAEYVGDEALLLARAAPTIIAHNRITGAHLAVMQGAGVIVMDDGMQNPSLAKTLTLALVDATDGFGSGFVFPAGPLRGFLTSQMKRADTVIKVGKGAPHASLDRLTDKALSGALVPRQAEWLKGARVLGFCGIGKPEKFRATLQELGADVVRFEAFPDHYMFDGGDAKRLIADAAHDNLTLVTTEKDYVRLKAFSETRAQLAGLANIVAIDFMPNERDVFDALLKRSLSPAGGA